MSIRINYSVMKIMKEVKTLSWLAYAYIYPHGTRRNLLKMGAEDGCENKKREIQV